MFNNLKKKKLFFFIVFVIIFFAINYSIGKEKSFLRNFKKIISEDIKLFLKENVFVHKYNDLLKNEVKIQKNKNSQLQKVNDNLISSKVLIKSTNNSFELTEKDSIFIYQKNFINIKETPKKNYLSNNNLEIYSYNLNNKEKCFSSKNSKNYVQIKIKNLIQKCEDPIFFQGIYNKNIYFYFSLKNKKINSKNKKIFKCTKLTLHGINLDLNPKLYNIKNYKNKDKLSYSLLLKTLLIPRYNSNYLKLYIFDQIKDKDCNFFELTKKLYRYGTEALFEKLINLNNYFEIVNVEYKL